MIKTFDELKEALLYRRIVEWYDNYIKLDSGMELKIAETEGSCSASAWGEFRNVTLDAAITNVSDIKYEPWEDCVTYGYSARVTVFHNQNEICEMYASADTGNGGYYYSIASFIIKMPHEKESEVLFVEVGS